MSGRMNPESKRMPRIGLRGGASRGVQLFLEFKQRNNMNSVIRVAAGLLALTGACSAWADPDPPPMGVWTGKGQFGYLSSSGNTDAQAVNANLDMTYTQDAWKHEAHLGGLYGANSGIVSAERWDARWQTNYTFTTTLFTFGALRYEHDMFDGFQYQASAAAGIGYKIFNTDASKLSVQLGAGFRDLRPEELVKDAAGAVTERMPGESQDNAILSAGLDFAQKLTASTTLTDTIAVEYSSGDSLITNNLALAVKISTKLALTLGYAIKDNTQPPAGLKKLDTVSTVNLQYAF
jgi:putative salt-induced outer membrane protein